MALLLGIDTGGTYTDAVLYDQERGVVASAKALTTKHDLALGVGEAIDRVLASSNRTIALVSLSTTLATNAIVEGQGGSVALMLIGYEESALARSGLGAALRGDPVAFISGGHSALGDEQRPLDLAGAEAAVLRYAGRVEAFAVAGYFAVRNPAHERAVAELAHSLSGLPVTCAHELSAELDAPRRALTAVLNARLIPLLDQLVVAVRGILGDKGINAPLMVVNGDGSLISAEEARRRPVETILSGPAASVVGARALAGEQDVFVVDMGGTTTDIALLRDGRPVLSREGAAVAGWRTMVEAIAVHTSGLGGDSEVRLDATRGLVVGPRRVVPLSLLGHQHPETIERLRQQLARDRPDGLDGRFALRSRSLDPAATTLSPAETRLWQRLADGPAALGDLLQGRLDERPLLRLVARGAVALSAFTPTDAAHVLALHSPWSVEAARAGAELWVRRPAEPAWTPAADAESFSRRVIEQVAVQSGRAIVAAALAEAHGLALDRAENLGTLLVERALSGQGAATDPLFDVGFTLRRPLVAIGAPVATYYPAVAQRLNTRLIIPPHHEVSNAVGAVAGGIVQKATVLVAPLDGARYRVHGPDGIADFADLADALRQGETAAHRAAAELARRAGAETAEVTVRREDRTVRDPGGRDLFIESRVVATAAGRPLLGERQR